MKEGFSGIGQCAACRIFIDNPEENFTCGHPQCNHELRQSLGQGLKEFQGFQKLLEDYDCDNFHELRKYIEMLTDMVTAKLVDGEGYEGELIEGDCRPEDFEEVKEDEEDI